MDPSDLRRLAEQQHDYLLTARRRLHQHPEPSGEERETAAFIASQLRSMGLEPRERSGGGFGVVADLVGERRGPTVALVAHIDALPMEEETDLAFRSRNSGVMHACGHDAITAVLLASARALTSVRTDLAGRVRFIFEPEEESPPRGGALALIEDGCMDGVDAVFGLHTGPSDAGRLHLTPGPILASVDNFGVSITGTSGHAAQPEGSVDAIQIAGHVITAIHQIIGRVVSPEKQAVISIGTVAGGIRENVIADHVTMTGTVRTMDREIRTRVEHTFKTLVRGVVESWGGDCEVGYSHGYPVLVNDPAMTDLARRAAALVLDRFSVVTGGWPPGMPSDDFARYLQLVPGAYAGLGVGTPGAEERPQEHSSAYYIDESGLSNGVAWYLALAMNFEALRNEAADLTGSA